MNDYVTIQEKLACVRRELAMRKNVYPKQVASGRLKQPAADHETAVMAAIVSDYEQLILSPRNLIREMTRNLALEEAAGVCEGWEGLAAAIRALKVTIP